MSQIYKLTIEIHDEDYHNAEDIETLLEESLAYLPDDLEAYIISCDPISPEESEYEDY